MLFEEIKVGMMMVPQTAKGFDFNGRLSNDQKDTKRASRSQKYTEIGRTAPTKITCIYKNERFAEFLLEWDTLIHHGEYKECLNAGDFRDGRAYVEPTGEYNFTRI